MKTQSLTEETKLKYGDERHIRVLIAVDNPLIIAGLQSILLAESDILLVGIARNIDEIQRLSLERWPDVIIFDLGIPYFSILKIVNDLRQQPIHAEVLLLGSSKNLVNMLELIKAGVMGYLLKDEDPLLVVQAIHAVIQGCIWFSSRAVDKFPQLTESSILTSREHEVIQLVAMGYTDQHISLVLGISERTIRNYLQKIYEKLSVRTRVEAAVQAVKRGWING